MYSDSSNYHNTHVSNLSTSSSADNSALIVRQKRIQWSKAYKRHEVNYMIKNSNLPEEKDPVLGNG